jgi:hypothetical protein
VVIRLIRRFLRAVLLSQLGNETNQAKDMELAKRLWDISVNVIKDKVGVVIDY